MKEKYITHPITHNNILTTVTCDTDAEIKENDWAIDCENRLFQSKGKYWDKRDAKVIFAYPHISGIPEYPQSFIDKLKGEDVEKLAEEYAIKRYGLPKDDDDPRAGDTEDGIYDFIQGYKSAKRGYTEEQMIEFADWCAENLVTRDSSGIWTSFKHKWAYTTKELLNKFLQSLNTVPQFIPKMDLCKDKT